MTSRQGESASAPLSAGHRTAADQFEPEVRALRFDAPRELQLRFESWLKQRYHLTPGEPSGQPSLGRFAALAFAVAPPSAIIRRGSEG
jgi:hypothetical protein